MNFPSPADETPDAPSSDEPLHRRRDRAESFGAVARAYDDARPGYPDALIVELLARGGLDVLDVASGTGRAARQLAARGARVLGVEPDEAMAAVAREHGVEIEVARFENWDDAGRRFDLVVCAQGWHWIDPVAGAAKAAAVLRPGGTLALVWNMYDLSPELTAALDPVYAHVSPDLLPAVRERSRRNDSAGGGRLAAAGFGPVQARRHEWEQTVGRDEWLAILATYSDHQLQEPGQRSRLLDALGEVIDRHGGTVTAHYTTLALLFGRTG